MADILRSQEYKDYGLTIKQAIKGSAALGYQVVFHPEAGFERTFDVSGLDVYLEYEEPEISSESNPPLTKPQLVIGSESTHQAGGKSILLCEFSLSVNAADNGRFELDAYTQLCQSLTRPEESNDYWVQFGLLPRKQVVDRVRDGGEYHPNLSGRMYIRSLFLMFWITGVLHYGPAN